MFPPTEHGVLSSGGEDEPAALDQTRVNSFKEGQDDGHHQGTNGIYLIGGEEKTTALDADDQNRVYMYSSDDGDDDADHQETIIGHDYLEECGRDVVVPQVQPRLYPPRLSQTERLSNDTYFWTLEQT